MIGRDREGQNRVIEDGTDKVRLAWQDKTEQSKYERTEWDRSGDGDRAMVDRRGWGVGKVKARVDQDPGVDKMCGRDGGRVSRMRRDTRTVKDVQW